MTVEEAVQVVAQQLIAAAVEDKLGRDHGARDEYPEIGEDDWDMVTVSAGRLAPFPAVDVYEAAYALLEARADHGAES